MPTILNIDPELLKKYQEEIEKVHSHATAKRKLSSLRRFFGWAEAKGHVPEGQLSVLSDRLSDTSRSVISSSVLADRQKTGNGEFPWLKVSGVAFGAFTTVVLTVFLARSIPGSLLLNLRGLAQTVQKVERVKVEEVVKVDQVAQESTPTPTQLPQPTQPPQQPQIPSSSDALTAKLLELIGENPAIKALGGVLDIASQGLTLRSYPTSDGDITLSPDGNGQVNIRSSTTTNDSLNIQNANLTTGNLISGYVGNNGTNYNLLYLSSGPIEQERFSVDSQGNTYIGGDTTTEGDMNVSGTLTASSANINGALSINRVTRISSLGRLSSITGYYQDSGLFEIDQGSPDSARITKSPTTAQGSATSDVLTLTLDETNTTGSAQDTLVLSRKNAGTGGYALDVRNGDVNFTGALNVSGATTLSSTISVAGDTTLTGDLAVNGGDITTTATTFNLLNSTATTINFAGAATTFNLADSTNTKTIDIGGVTSDGTDTINIATNGTTNADTITIGNSNASTTVAITGGDDWNMAGTGVLTMSASASQTTAIVVTDTDYTNALSIGDNNITGTTANIDLTNFDVTGSTGDITTAGDLAVNGGDITTTAATFNLVNAATTLNIGSTSVTRAINLGTGTLADTINIGNGGTTADLIYIGNSATANTITIGSTSSTTVSITDDNWNITAAGLANFVSVGAATPGTGAFTTLTSNNTTTIGNGSGIITSIGNSGGAAAINLTSGTGSQTFTSSVATGTTTSSAFVFTDSALTSGTLLYLTSTATSGKSIDLNIANTSGTVVNGAYGGAKILGGALIGVSLDLSTNVTATGQNITGISLTTNPAVTNTGAGTYAYKGVVISAGAITQNTEAGTNTSTGLDVTNPNITQTTGTITANGLLVTTGSITTGGTQNGVNVSASGVGAGALNAINIGTITGSGGTETAINIAAGWDTDINATTSLEIGIGGTNEVTLTSSAFSPTTTDGNALGTTSLMWSDLFLASGAVINFNNGDVTVTHAADSLAITGGNVGIGTTSPSQKLHVEGQCVAKGTRIRRRRRRKTMDDGEIEDGNLKMEDGEWKENNLSSTLNPQNTTLHPLSSIVGDYIYEDIPVEDVKPDDEVLSLNDVTGEFEWHTVEKTMDMGIQEVFRLETESGKWIETTSEHPYLVKVHSSHQKTAYTAALVNLTGMLSDQTDNLDSNISQHEAFVKSENMSVDLPGVEPGRPGLSVWSSKPAKPTPLSLSQIKVDWVKVSQLKVGMEIATVNGWEKIVSITKVGRKQTYDLQIAGTHNFVGHEIVAHNTYINSATDTGVALDLDANSLTTGTGIDVSSTAAALSSGKMFSISKTGASGSTAFTGDIASVTYSQTFNGGVGLNSTGNVLDVSRAITIDNTGNTHTVSGALVTIADSGVETNGDINNTSNILSLAQNCGTGVTCSGAVLKITNSGTGADISLKNSETISNGTDGTITFGADKLTLTGTTATSGTLFTASYTAAAIQDAALTGLSFDISTNVTVPNTASGNQTGISLTVKDGGSLATAIGISIAGTADRGIDFSGLTTSSGGSIVYNDISSTIDLSSVADNVLEITNSSGTAANDNTITLEVDSETDASDKVLFRIVSDVGGDEQSKVTIDSDGDIVANNITLNQGFTCADCLDFDDFEDTLDLDNNLTLNQTTYTWGQTFTGDTTTGFTYTANSLTTGTALRITSSGTITSGGELLDLVGNGITTGNVVTASATALTSGSLLSFTGPSGATVGATGDVVTLTSDIGNAGAMFKSTATFDSTAASASSYNAYLSTTNSNGTNANTAYGFYSTLSDAIALPNTDYGIYSNMSNSGANTLGTKTVYGLYSTSTNTSTGVGGTANTYGGYFSATGDTGGASTTFGIYATASGADTNYALYVVGQCVARGTRIKTRRRRKSKTDTDSGPDPLENLKFEISNLKSILNDEMSKNLKLRDLDLIKNLKLKIKNYENQVKQLESGNNYSDWIYEDIPVEDIKPDDEVLSLNDQTGEFEWHTVEKTMDKGVQKVFELLTESGKSIETTAEHPYLVWNDQITDFNWLQKDSFEYTEKLARKFYYERFAGKSIFVPAVGGRIRFTQEGWNHFVQKSRSINELITRFFALPRVPTVFRTSQNITGYRKLEKGTITIEYWELQAIVEYVHVRVIVSAVNGGSKFFLSCNWLGTKQEGGIETNKKELSLSPRGKSHSGRRRRLVTSQLFNKLNIPEDKQNVKWTKVNKLKLGMKIATLNGWERVISIKEKSRKKTYDLQIEGTHNFVGNEIVAHNTYLSGNVGIGTTSPAQKLHVEGQCVIGNTLLSIKKKKKRRGDEEDDEAVEGIPIKDIKPGMEVYSLNEETGRFEAHKIKALLDMGVKPVFKLITQSGREITTTGNHPYLVQLTYDELQRRIQLRETGSLERDYGLSQGSLSTDYEFSETRTVWTDRLNTKKSAEADFGDPTKAGSNLAYHLESRILQNNSFVKSEKGVEVAGFAPAEPWMISQVPHSGTPTPGLSSQKDLVNSRWTKVIYLSPGDLIAVSSLNSDLLNSEHALWDKIQSIEYVGEEQVYDIEVEGTHNFVAGHYLNKKTGKALTQEQEKAYIEYLSQQKTRLSADSLTDSTVDTVASDFSRRSLAQETGFVKSGAEGNRTPATRVEKSEAVPTAAPPKSLSQILGEDVNEDDVVYGGIVAHNTYVSGNVGIGTTSPGAKLAIKDGSMHLDETNGLIYFTTDGGAAGTNTASFIGRADTAGYHVTSGDGGFASLANSFVIGSQVGPLIFATTDAGSFPSGRMIIDANGNVGIGTTGPGYKLDVAGGANLSSGNAYYINGASVLNATTLGSGVVSSSLTSVGIITTGTWNATVVGATYGGTGQNAVTAGDILYGSAANTWSRLADVATGNALISGGVGVAPSWGKVVLGTHTSGNYVSSITGTANQITASAATGDVTLSIPSDFRAPGTVNAVSGLYTGATAGTLRLDSSGALSNITSLTLSGAISGGTTYSGSGNITSTAGVLTISGTGNSSIAGNVGIGTTGPGKKLDVVGEIRSSSTLTVSGGGATITAGNLGIGTSPVGTAGLYMNGAITSGSTTQYGMFIDSSASTGATTAIYGMYMRAGGAAGTYTTGNVYGIYVATPAKGAGQTVTTAYGSYIQAQSAGSTSNYGIYVAAPSGGSGTNSGITVAGGGIAVTGNSTITGTLGGLTGLTVASGGAVMTNTAGGVPTVLQLENVGNIVDDGVSLDFRLRDSGNNIADYVKIRAMIEDSTDGSEDGSLRFLTTVAGTNATRMTIGAGGNVGIGTTSPGDKLDVWGTTDQASRIRVKGTGTDSNVGLDLANDARSWLFQVNGWDSDKLVIHDATASLTRMTFDSSGNVGIGASPGTSGTDFVEINTTSNTNALWIEVDNGETQTAANIVARSQRAASTAYNFFSAVSDSDGTPDVEFYLRGDGTGLADGSWTGGGADVAEWTPTRYASELEPGDVLVTDGSFHSLTKKSEGTPYAAGLMGVVSTNPGLVAGGGDAESEHGKEDVLVALAGRVPVKVSTENGPILPGDALTSSSIPGVAMKATRAGQVVGKALESFDSAQGESCPVSDQQKTALSSGSLTDVHSNEVAPDLSGKTITQTDTNVNSPFGGVDLGGVEPPPPDLTDQMPHRSRPTPNPVCGKVMTFVNVSWYDPDVYLTSTGDIQLKNSQFSIFNFQSNSNASMTQTPNSPYIPLYSLKDAAGNLISRIGVFSEAVIGNLQAGIIKSSELISDNIVTRQLETRNLVVKEDLVSPIVKADTVKARKLLSDEAMMQEATVSALAAETITSSSPSGDLTVDLSNESNWSNGSNLAETSGFGRLLLKGNLEVSGHTQTETLDVASDASVSGTLYADRIKANQIDLPASALREALQAGGIQGVFEEMVASRSASQSLAFESASYENQTVVDRLRKRLEGLDNAMKQWSDKAMELSGHEAIEQTEAEKIAYSNIEKLLADTASGSATLSFAAETDWTTLASQGETLQGYGLNLTGGLNVLGDTNFYGNTTVQRLVVANSSNSTNGTNWTNLVLASDSLSVVGGKLNLLGSEGVDIMAGTLIVDAQGNVSVNGNLNIIGRLTASTIGAQEGGDLTLDLGRTNSSNLSNESNSTNLTSESSGFGELLVRGVNGETVASIDASGSATFRKLVIAAGTNGSNGTNLTNETNLVASDATSNATAGKGVLLAGETILTLYNKNVSDNTLIYVTPTTSTGNQVLYVKSKLAHSASFDSAQGTSSGQVGQFIVAVDKPISHDVEFNWWIIELKN